MRANQPSSISRRERIGLALTLVAVALLGLAAVRPAIHGYDGVGYYVYLASLMRSGDLDLSDDYRRFDALKQYPSRFSDWPSDPRTGLPGNRYGVGAALLWAPAVAAMHGALRLAAPAHADAVGPPYAWAVGVATAFWGSLGLALIYTELRRRWRPAACAATLAGLLLATPLGFYLYAHGSMAHGVGFFAAAGLWRALLRGWRRPGARELAAVGAWAALLVMIRFQDVTWAAIGCAVMMVRAMTSGRATIDDPGTVSGSAFRLRLRLRLRETKSGSEVLAVAAMGLAGVVVFIPQLITWKILYGSYFSGPTPYLDRTAGAFAWHSPHLLQGLFCARHGALGWHPLLAVGLAGLVGLLGQRREDDQGGSGNPWRAAAALGLAGFAAQAWLVGCWSIWWAGASFGNRFFISALPFVAPGIALWLGGGTARRGAAGARRARWPYALLALLIVWNGGLLVQYATRMVPREEPVDWGTIVRQNVIDVPRLVWRRAAGLARPPAQNGKSSSPPRTEPAGGTDSPGSPDGGQGPRNEGAGGS